MSVSQKHPYHLIDPSPWPLLGSLGALASTIGGVMFCIIYLTIASKPTYSSITSQSPFKLLSTISLRLCPINIM